MSPLKQWRKANGTSVAEVARRLGVSRQVVHLWERGAPPSLSNALAVQKLTKGGVRAFDLLFGDRNAGATQR